MDTNRPGSRWQFGVEDPEDTGVLRRVLWGATREGRLCHPGVFCIASEVLPRREYVEVTRSQHALAVRRWGGGG